MAARKKSPFKKFYTVEEANAVLPLLRSILRDITELAGELRERTDRLRRVRVNAPVAAGHPHDEELPHAQAELERDQERMREYETELKKLNVELKDYFTGLVDFPCLMDDKVVYLCWKLGEPEVAYWHELDAGFQGRKKLERTPASN